MRGQRMEMRSVEPHVGELTHTERVRSTDDLRLVAALRRGEEAAFVWLIDQHYSAMVRVAMTYVSSAEVAEEVVQETLLGVLQSLGRFQARSSFRTWLFRILVNRAISRAARERRSVPFSALSDPAAASREPAVEPSRFRDSEPGRDHWLAFPRSWDDLPEDRLLSGELRAHVRAAIVALPPRQRAVISLRDIEGWPADDVARILGITQAHQRVLLHRARSHVRGVLERYFGES